MTYSRKDKILERLNITPITAAALAESFGVSRQVIVGDIALLRAMGHDILSTPKGYIKNSVNNNSEQYFLITCRHGDDKLLEELYIIVDNGAVVLDVLVEHEVYGQIQCPLFLTSRYDCDQFLEKITNSNSKPLSSITNGIHMHTIKCKDEECYSRIYEKLKKLNIIVD